MKIQLLSDLHLETEAFLPQPAPGADLLVLAGDVDSSWRGLQLFRDWPVPVLFVPGNHEYDGRDFDLACAGLHALADELGFTMLDNASCVHTDSQGRRVRFVGSTRWSDFDVFGPSERARAMRAASYFQRMMAASRDGQPFDAIAVRAEALNCREWLTQELTLGDVSAAWDATVVITHFAPSLRSADPRYGKQPGTASFCNDDEALFSQARLWLHGHLHCQHDYLFERAGGATRVICNARGHQRKGEPARFEPELLIDVFATLA
ncbi:metallophosphoesterase [Roseateles oligotrophus]|uniref:Metallophosphoesterase n=1 Tax=Roseateles oligotrophus TaxID=1769250 RepID=A0ABT2YCK2_9BURK|nr:metallophosphoesterase [Roseateles oligotrophus]MCV2367775.1 metallophosphoesterase [Roseateles oligotrophus]